jgi:hypothetical protein
MSNLKLVILLGFVLIFAAGITVGRSPSLKEQPQTKGHEHSWLSNQLHLSSPQEAQMKTIWSDPSITRPDLPKLCREADHQRDEAIRNMLTPDERAKYDQIQRDHDATIAAIFGEKSQAMRDAEEKTRMILSDEQRKKYDEILKAHGHHGPPVRRRTRGNGPAPAPAPAAAPQTTTSHRESAQ